ncbi:MAG: hypothetical protein LBE91_21925 [Tannerella sp.]|jgi:hypothetical protein|nr:hypothetical protein [Tannerella sp.]
MKSLRVPFINQLDNLDIQDVSGIMETEAVRISIDTVNWKEFPYKPVTVADIARGKNDLYLHYFVRGLSLKALAVRDGEYVHTDSCVEFFMRREDEPGYTNFEFNCRGICYANRSVMNRNERIPLTDREYTKIRRFCTVQGDAFPEISGLYAWDVTVAIPFELMGLDGEKLPEKIFGNFYKCADETANPHYLSWNPIPLPAPSFHCPDYFGEIYL